jgi:hypothetical protein
MKWFTPAAMGLLVAAALLVLLTRPRPAPAAPPRHWESADAAAWADPADAELSRDLDARQADALRRSATKTALTESLLRGDLTLAEAAGHFRAANVGGVLVYGNLPDVYPEATEEELSYRQVVLFVRGLVRVYPDAVAARLPDLEAEVARRFPADPLKAVRAG